MVFDLTSTGDIDPFPEHDTLTVDHRKKRTEHGPIFIDGAAVEQVESFKFLGVHITNKLTWSKHIRQS